MSKPLRFRWRTFHLPKAGQIDEEYEDAVAGDVKAQRFAIADGASECAFADVWARLLVNAYVQTPGPWDRWLGAARRDWERHVRQRELTWYDEMKVAEGAYAALLGFAVRGNRWRATAVGDCCLFQVRADRLIRSFPLQRAAEFNNRPVLLGSRRPPPSEPRLRKPNSEGTLRSGDQIFFMTDALAEWFLNQTEHDQSPWHDVRRLIQDDQGACQIQDWRGQRLLRNDDVTLATLDADEP